MTRGASSLASAGHPSAYSHAAARSGSTSAPVEMTCVCVCVTTGLLGGVTTQKKEPPSAARSGSTERAAAAAAAAAVRRRRAERGPQDVAAGALRRGREAEVRARPARREREQRLR